MLSIVLRIVTLPEDAFKPMKFSQEEEDEFMRKLEEKRKAKLRLTEEECRKYPLEELEKMERSGTVTVPSTVRAELREYRDLTQNYEEKRTLEQKEDDINHKLKVMNDYQNKRREYEGSVAKKAAANYSRRDLKRIEKMLAIKEKRNKVNSVNETEPNLSNSNNKNKVNGNINGNNYLSDEKNKIEVNYEDNMNKGKTSGKFKPS